MRLRPQASATWRSSLAEAGVELSVLHGIAQAARRAVGADRHPRQGRG